MGKRDDNFIARVPNIHFGTFRKKRDFKQTGFLVSGGVGVVFHYRSLSSLARKEN